MSRALPSLLIGALALAGAARAEAGELQVDVALSARATTWRGDFGGGPQLRLAYRIARVVAVDAVFWEEVSSVDARLDTGLTFGATGFLDLEVVRASLRLYFVHQHEEALVSVLDNPFGAAFGIGSGIRHRAGAGGTVGVEIPFERSDVLEWVIVANASLTVFGEATLGPRASFGLTGGIGFNYDLPGLP